MSRTLYEEAIADAQKLRELAEETAKNRVVEAVMPQIRDLVNRRILGEQIEDFEAEEETIDVLPPPVEELPLLDLGIEEESTESAPSPVINVSAEGDVNIDVGPADESEEELVLSDAMAEALAHLIQGESTEGRRLRVVEEAVEKMRTLFESKTVSNFTPLQKRKLCLYFNHCLKEALSLCNSNILSELNTHEELGQRLTEVIKEMRNMSKRPNIFDILFEQDEVDAAVDVEDAVVDDELAAEEPVEVDPVEAGDALVDLGAVLGLDVTVGEEVEEELDVEEEVDVAGDEELAFEASYLGEDDVYEIDEAMLRKEISRMRKLREQEESDAVDADPYLDHGGEVVVDDVLEVDEDDLINALADELGDVPAPTVESRRRRVSRRARRPRRRVAEARQSRRSGQQLRQYRTAVAGMKKQLVEMNLFNAKLLYANKLMQNKNLSMKQQRAIVEAIDNAKTLREAKLLYKSLSESLARRDRGSKLNEGALRTLGSSSRSTRSAQPNKSGVEVDRWAVLAGINGND